VRYSYLYLEPSDDGVWPVIGARLNTRTMRLGKARSFADAVHMAEVLGARLRISTVVRRQMTELGVGPRQWPADLPTGDDQAPVERGRWRPPSHHYTPARRDQPAP